MTRDDTHRAGEGRTPSPPDSTGSGPDGGAPGPDARTDARTPSSGGKWVVRTLFAALGLATALGMAWYAAEGYRQAGGEPGGADAGSARADTASAPDGALRARRKTGSSRWLSIRAPVITFPTLSGDTASLAGLKGQVVVLNFWATWCPPCEREIPELAQLQDSLRSRPATVVGIAVSSGSREKIRAFGEEHGINYPIWLSDPGTAATEYRAVGLPTTLLVDGRGIIRRRYMGPQSYETLSGDVRALLDSASSPPGGGAPAGTGAGRDPTSY